MKKVILVLLLLTLYTGIQTCVSAAESTPEPVVKLEIPAENLEKIDIKYEKETDNKAVETVKNADTEIKKDSEKAVTEVKEVENKTESSVKKATDSAKAATAKASENTKKAAKKTTEAAKKTTEAAKTATDKTVKVTKSVAKNTAYETKEIIDTVNPNKVYTKEELEKSSAVKTMKNERNEIKSAYNSRIKDIDAKIKSTEKSTNISDVQKRNIIYELNKEKTRLQNEKNDYVEKYNKKIEAKRESK